MNQKSGEGDSEALLRSADRIEQLQQQIETWQAMQSKLGGIDGEGAIASPHLAKRDGRIANRLRHRHQLRLLADWLFVSTRHTVHLFTEDKQC